jgi:hypothetical protein
MSQHHIELWGRDLKPARTGPLPRRNRYTVTRTRFISPAIAALATLGFFIVAALW